MAYGEVYVGIVDSFLPKKESKADDGVLREEHVVIEVPLVIRLRNGFDMIEFRRLQELLLVSEEEMGRCLGISPATLHRRKKAVRLATPESERILRLARLFGKSLEVFESEAAAREWLKAPNPGTAGETPISYADTEFGAREVEYLLGRIDHGVFS